MLFKLLAGLHVQDDKDKPVLDDKGKPIPGRFHSKTYSASQVIESDIDLADRHGHQKYQPLQGETRNTSRTAGDKSPGMNPTSFPGGQVASGFQESTSPTHDEALGTIPSKSGPASDEVRKKLEAAESRANESQVAQKPTQKESIRATPAQLDAMSQKDLKEYAEDREIDLRGAKTRDDILKVLKTAK
jgi:hypothetical protein